MAATVEARGADGMNESVSGRGWNLCRRPWWQQVSIQHHRSTPATSPRHRHDSSFNEPSSSSYSAQSAGALIRTLLRTRRRLRFDPDNKLYFPYEPGKQATSAVRIKNVSRSLVAFKFQTTAPKSCFMRPPNGVLAPGESIIATVVKFIEQRKIVEQPERSQKKKTRDKFKIVSLKMQDNVEFAPELFDEQKEHVAEEQILQVVLLDPNQPTPELQKLKSLIAEVHAAQAAQEAPKKPTVEKAPSFNNIGGGDVLEEWKQRKLARQQAK